MKNNRLEILPGHGPRAGAEPARRPLSASRSALLETLRSQHSPVTLAALATASRLHANTVREHLDALVEAGLAERHQAEPQGRGRPAWLYRATGDDVAAAPEYAGLAAALAGAISRTSTAPAADAEEAGTLWGRTLAGQRGVRATAVPDQARGSVVALLDDLGFSPETDDSAHTVRLRTCPLLQAAHEHPEVVCAVHLGLAKGVLSTAGVDGSATELEPFAEPGACILRLH